jgi:hypothetical protein
LTRQLFYHQNRLDDLPPVYDYCLSNRCLAPEADRPNNCPDCPVNLSWDKLERDYKTIIRRDTLRDLTEEGVGGAEAEIELDSRLGAGAQFQELINSISVALEMEGYVAEDTYSPKWNIRTTEVVKIIRQERASIRREERYKARMAREAETQRANARTGGGWRGEAE